MVFRTLYARFGSLGLAGFGIRSTTSRLDDRNDQNPPVIGSAGGLAVRASRKFRTMSMFVARVIYLDGIDEMRAASAY